MEKLAQISDQEVRIEFALNCKCRANLRLTSLCPSSLLAFKVQTSSPHKFLVNPPSGLIPPSSFTTFQIILKPQEQLPPTFPRCPSDRFLIKTARFTRNLSDPIHPDSINSWLSSRPAGSTQDIKLKVAFVGPLLLRHAVSAGDVDAVKSLIKRQKMVVSELPHREAESLLRVAAELVNSVDMVTLLLEAGLTLRTDARVDSEMDRDRVHSKLESKWWNELQAAMMFDRTDEALRMIKMRGSRSLDFRDKEGRTLLHLAATKGNLKYAKALVESGADKDARSKNGKTALYRAAANGDRRMVETLIELGADPTITTDRGRSAIGVASDKGHREIVDILERGEAVLMAARRGDIEHLEALLQQGANINNRDQYGLTALHAAALKGHKEAVALLVEHGLDLECRDHEGHAPLHLAVERGSIETVRLLVDKGANVDVKSSRGATPLYLARAMGYDEISLFLINKGASPLLSTLSSSPGLL